jgi:6-phosphogluconolactonase
MNPTLEILPDREALAHRAAERLIAAAREAPANFAIVLSGGSTPRRLYELLGSAPYRETLPWDRMHVFFGDERFVPKSDARSNHRMADEALLSHVPIPSANVHPIPTEGMTPDEAALAYEGTLKSFYGAARLDSTCPLFDVTLLGLGEDGHIASLFPGARALSERGRWVVAVREGAPEPRITLTFPPLESSRHVLFLVAGEEKRAVLEGALRGDPQMPATRLRPSGTVRWLADAAAAREATDNAKP